MDSKIKWYKEVLALEPGSKLFFPLAQLYAENGQYIDALETISKGLEKHPEHFEAQLFQVEILSNLDRRDEAQEIVATLTEKMMTYPAFWQEWAKIYAEREQDRDIALALNFLAATFKGSPIGWTEIIERGLAALLSEEEPTAGTGPRGQMREAMARMVDQVSRNELLQSGDEATPLSTAATSEGKRSDKSDTFSLRTRSMAELLAKQGDYEGAIDIYQELVESAPGGKAREELRSRLLELKSQMENEVAQDEAASSNKDGKEGETTEEQTANHGKKRLIGTLEALAQRLEARATS